MKWFKHYTNASDSVKLNHLIDDLGIEGYGRYWLLLEMLAEEFDGSSTTFHIHSHKISSKVRIKFSKKLATFMQKLSNFHLIEFKLVGKVYEIESPILLELQSRDFKTARNKRGDTVPKNKIKNKIKDKDLEQDKELEKDKELKTAKAVSVPAESLGDFKWFVDVWNQKVYDLPSIKILSKKRAQLLKALIKQHGKEEIFWENFLTQIQQSDFLTGRDGKWQNCSVDWVLNPNNFLKVLEGNYSKNQSKSDHWNQQWERISEGSL